MAVKASEDALREQQTEDRLVRGNELSSRLWLWTNTALTIIGLASITDGLVNWMWVIHVVVDWYLAARNAAFGWLPFRVPPELRDPIVLLIAWFSASSMGYYREVGRVLLADTLRLVIGIPVALALTALKKLAEPPSTSLLKQLYLRARSSLWDTASAFVNDVVSVRSQRGIRTPREIFRNVWPGSFVFGMLISILIFGFGIWNPYLIGAIMLFGPVVMAAGGAFAWRWTLGTFAMFALLVASNYAYLEWIDIKSAV